MNKGTISITQLLLREPVSTVRFRARRVRWVVKWYHAVYRALIHILVVPSKYHRALGDALRGTQKGYEANCDSQDLYTRLVQRIEYDTTNVGMEFRLLHCVPTNELQSRTPHDKR